MSTPVTNLLDDLFRDLLLRPTTTDSSHDDDERHDHLHHHTAVLSIVYVSSDETAASFDAYVKPGWRTVPFAHTDERAALKRHFRTCAKREMADLHMLATRDYEIPHLVVLSAADDTQHVLTDAGIQDVKELGAAAVNHWMELKRLQAALESKYYDDSQDDWTTS